MKAYIVLENGDIFAGVLNNTSSKQVYGDVVFYTSMTAYEEIITDPTVHNHIIVFTSPLIGNCGINKKRVESNHIQASGLIVNELSEEGYHYESNLSLGDYCND